MEFSRFNFCWLFSRFRFDGCRFSVDGSRFIVAGGAFFTLDFSRFIAGSFFALDDSLFTEFGTDFVLPLLSFEFLAPFDGDEFFELIFCGIFVGDFGFIGLGSLELVFELLRLIPLTFEQLGVRTGILVGESLPNFLIIPSVPQWDESCSQSLFGVPTIGDNVVGFEIRFIARDGVNVDGPMPKSIIDPPRSLPGLRRGDTELSRR